MSRVVIDVWVTFTDNNTMTCEYSDSDGIDVLVLGYNLDEYNNYREALADFILDAGLSDEYWIQYHYCT